MKARLGGRIADIVSVTGATALVNLATTVLLARWFGLSAYADYLVGLSVLSLMLGLQEALPTSYAVFRAQDEPKFLEAAAFSSISVALVVALLVAAVGTGTDSIRSFSYWMVLAVAALGVKRYQDIRLQSAGRLREFFRIDFAASLVRLAVMAVASVMNVEAANAVWSALAIGLVAAQAQWFFRNPAESKLVRGALGPDGWQRAMAEARRYPPYYVGSLLKRAKDNVVPLLTGSLLATAEATGIFLLAYRGVSFVLTQIRLIEGVINHRQALAEIQGWTWMQLGSVASVGQVASIVLGIALLGLANAAEYPWSALAVMSFIPWFYTYSVVGRARALSVFDAGSVNRALGAYLAVCAMAVAVSGPLGVDAPVFVSAAVLLAEGAYFVTLRRGAAGRATRHG